MSPPGPPLVAHVIHRLDFGGLENGLVNLVNRIPADRYRHAVLCLSGINQEFRRRIRRPDVEVLSLDKQPGKDPAVYLRMWRLLRRLRPRILHTRNLGTVDMQWIGLLAGVPHRVHGEHGWEASDPQGASSRSLAIRRACRPVVHRYVPMSKDIARWLVSRPRWRSSTMASMRKDSTRLPRPRGAKAFRTRWSSAPWDAWTR
jgi:hypothetical protein